MKRASHEQYDDDDDDDDDGMTANILNAVLISLQHMKLQHNSIF